MYNGTNKRPQFLSSLRDRKDWRLKDYHFPSLGVDLERGTEKITHKWYTAASLQLIAFNRQSTVASICDVPLMFLFSMIWREGWFDNPCNILSWTHCRYRSHVQRVVSVHSSDKLLLSESLRLAVIAFPHRVHSRREVSVIVVRSRVERIGWSSSGFTVVL